MFSALSHQKVSGLFNLTTLRKAKNPLSLGHFECRKVKAKRICEAQRRHKVQSKNQHHQQTWHLRSYLALFLTDEEGQDWSKSHKKEKKNNTP